MIDAAVKQLEGLIRTKRDLMCVSLFWTVKRMQLHFCNFQLNFLLQVKVCTFRKQLLVLPKLHILFNTSWWRSPQCAEGWTVFYTLFWVSKAHMIDMKDWGYSACPYCCLFYDRHNSFAEEATKAGSSHGEKKGCHSCLTDTGASLLFNLMFVVQVEEGQP